MTAVPSNERLMLMVDVIDDRGKGLTPWEIEFIEGVINKDTFSEKQAKVIERIYDERVPS